jgi:hypothetical protein
MRNVLALVGAATVTFLVVGWYLGWYQVSSLPSPGGRQSLHVDINSEKITEDVRTGVEKGTEIVDNLREKAKDGPKPATNSGPASNFFMPPRTEGQDPPNGWTPIGAERPQGGEEPSRSRLPRN